MGRRGVAVSASGTPPAFDCPRTMAALTFSHIQQRDGCWCIVDLVGKHGRVRTAPMPTWVRWLWIPGPPRGRRRRWKCFPACEPGGPSRRGALGREGCIADAPAVCGGSWCSQYCASRPPAHLREVVPSGGRRAGADPAAAWPCFGADDRAVSRDEAGLDPCGRTTQSN
jgi:hypothetical protein